MPRKTPIEKVVTWKNYTGLRSRMEHIEEEFRKLRKEGDFSKTLLEDHRIEIVSGGDLVSINHDANWHKCICNYDGDRCLGTPRPHWTTKWSIQANGFHLEEMYDQDFKGWRGQYKTDNDLKYDQLPKDILKIHSDTIVQIHSKMGQWFPCHIYDDINGVLYRP